MSRVLDKLSTRVQHHPSRASLLDALLTRLDGLDPEVIPDPGGRQRSTWRTHRACLESLPDDASHLLVLQDDAWPCDNFAASVRAAIAEKPERIICLFMSGASILNRRMNIARKAGERWMEFPQTTYIPLVAVVYPAEVARQIPAFADKKKIPVSRVDDAVVGMFCRAHRLTATVTVPSLVQHRDDIDSAMGYPSGHGHAHRVAAWYDEAQTAFA